MAEGRKNLILVYVNGSIAFIKILFVASLCQIRPIRFFVVGKDLVSQ